MTLINVIFEDIFRTFMDINKWVFLKYKLVRYIVNNIRQKIVIIKIRLIISKKKK